MEKQEGGTDGVRKRQGKQAWGKRQEGWGERRKSGAKRRLAVWFLLHVPNRLWLTNPVSYGRGMQKRRLWWCYGGGYSVGVCE